MVNYRQRQQALRKGFFGSPLLSACLLTLPVLVSAETARADIQTGRSATRALANSSGRPKGPVIVTPTPTGPPCPGSSSNRLLLQREESGPLPPHPSQDVQAKPRHLSLASQHYRHGLLGGGRTHGTQSGSQPQKLVGFRMAGKLRRLRQPGFPFAARGTSARKHSSPRKTPFTWRSLIMTFPEGSIRRRASRVIPWFRREYAGKGQSVCKGRWVQIVYNKRSCFAQWEDCGPFTTEDWPYVFGDKASPSIPRTKGRALTSPLPYATIWALREEQPLSTGALWNFYRIPRGPWSKYGDNNPFVNAGLGAGKKSLQLREDRLRQQQEAIQRELLKDPAKLRRELQG